MSGPPMARRLAADLSPSPDQARQWVQDELAKDDYQDRESLLQRLVHWVTQRLADLQNHQGDGGVSLPPIVITVLAVLFALGVAYLLTRVRRERRTVASDRAVLGDRTLTADDYRRRAAAAEAENRWDDAVLDLTRAIAREADARTLLTDAPSLTAHEIGRQLADVFPAHAGDIARAMDRFDAVAYGGVAVGPDDVADTRRTDDAVRRARPRLPDRPRHDSGDRNGDVARAEASASVWSTGVAG